MTIPMNTPHFWIYYGTYATACLSNGQQPAHTEGKFIKAVSDFTVQETSQAMQNRHTPDLFWFGPSGFITDSARFFFFVKGRSSEYCSIDYNKKEPGAVRFNAPRIEVFESKVPVLPLPSDEIPQPNLQDPSWEDSTKRAFTLSYFIFGQNLKMHFYLSKKAYGQVNMQEVAKKTVQGAPLVILSTLIAVAVPVAGSVSFALSKGLQILPK